MYTWLLCLFKINTLTQIENFNEISVQGIHSANKKSIKKKMVACPLKN